MKSEPITSFSGNYRFLSNFYSASVELDGVDYRTVEHAFQAAKTLNASERGRIQRTRSPGAAKHIGRRVTLRPEWEEVKIEVMRRLVYQKFYNYPVLARGLVATGDSLLVEGNTWNDRFWGECPVGIGHNHLGKILMEVRTELKGKST